MPGVPAREVLLLGKAEAAYATDPTLAAADAVLVSSPELTPFEADDVDPEIVRPYLGAAETLSARVRARVAFGVALVGVQPAGEKDGTVAIGSPPIDKLLLACGMTAATSKATDEDDNAATKRLYRPETNVDGSSLALEWILGKTAAEHQILGARGTWTIEVRAAGIPRINFEFFGIYQKPNHLARALTGISYTAYKQPEVASNSNSKFSLHGNSTHGLHNISISLGATPELSELIGAPSQVVIGNREVTGTISLRTKTLEPANLNLFEIADKRTKGALELTLGYGDISGDLTHTANRGRIVQISAPSVQIRNPRYGTDPQGLSTTDCDLRFLPTGDGNNEITIGYQ